MTIESPAGSPSDEAIRLYREPVPEALTRVAPDGLSSHPADQATDQTIETPVRARAPRTAKTPTIVRRLREHKWLTPILSIAIVGLSTLAGLFSPEISFAIVVIAAVVAVLRYLPIQPLMLAVSLIALGVDNPRSSPANGNWQSPWIFLAGALYRNLEPLPVCLLDLMAVGCAVRGLLHVRQESKIRIGRERVFARIVAIALGTIVVSFALGVLRGGDLKQATYQGRVFVWMPCFAIGIATVGDLKFLRKLKTVMITAACMKGLTGLWVTLTVTPKSEKTPLDFVTVHGDSVTYAMVFSVIVASWVAGVEKKFRKWHGIGMLLTLVGLYTNQRRIAFVGMAFALLLMYEDAIPERRRAINRTISRFILPGVLYFAIAFTGVSRNAIFRPALSLRSVVIQDDRSSSTRDVENFNLYYTYKTNPFIGIGFGKEYIEFSRGDYIGDVFPQYKFLPHNSLLGLFAYAGLLGAGGYYVIFPGVLYLGLRATKRYYTPERWALSMWGASGIAAVLIQGYGDVGLHDQIVGVLGGIALGICGALYCGPDSEKPKAGRLDARAAVRIDGSI
jgi:O-Antigen ligase